MDVRAFLFAASNDDMSTRTRDNAAANETEDIEMIIQAINTRSPVGLRILAAFKDAFGCEITAARTRSGSSRGTHYDFEVQVNGVWKKVEHKGSQTYCVPASDARPWQAGVQFYNGGCEKYSLTRKYARVWYTTHIESGTLASEFGITAPIPSFEEWVEKDCRSQGDPGTAFGKELKQKVRDARGPKASLLEKRAIVLDRLEITDDDKTTLLADVLPIANHVLDEKEYWLSIHGNLSGEFRAVWYPQFRIEAIKEVIIEKALDVKFTFVCENGFRFTGILRWGKGAGFSCLRLDLK